MKLVFASSLCFAAIVVCESAMGATLRPPSVPIVSCDPYFSIWSGADAPNLADTEIWHGAKQPVSVEIELDGVRYHHLIDPATLRPSAQSFRSVTVVCEDPAEADLLSTALFLLNETEGRRLAEAFGAAVYYH